jgi:hypothetical protein
LKKDKKTKVFSLVFAGIMLFLSAGFAQNQIDPEWVYRWQFSLEESDQGDVNGNNGLDITYGIAYFKGGSDPLCPDCPPCNSWHYCGDVNGSCGYNGLDVTYGVAYFKAGPGPIHCPDCPPNG